MDSGFLFGRLLVLALAWSFVSSAGAQEAQSGLIPLKVGNTWNYSLSRYDKAGKLLGREDATAKVAEEKKVGPKTWYKLNEFGDDFWVRDDAEGQYEAVLNYEEETSPDRRTRESLFYRYPVDETPFKYKLEFGEMTVVSDSTEVTTNAGKFSCYHYQLVETDLKIDMFIARGKGLVKHRFEDEAEVSVAELESMRLVED